MPSEAIRAQNLVRALCQLASCPFPILSLNENAPEFPSNNNQPESKIPVSQTPLYPGPCGRVSASGRNERFQEEQPGLCGHIHLENHHPALKLALVSQGVASGSSPLWAQVLPDGGHRAEGCRNPEEAEATAGNAAPPLRAGPHKPAFQSNLVRFQRTASLPRKCILMMEHKSFRTARLHFKRSFDFYI